MQFDAIVTQSSAQPHNDQFSFQYITILRELELKMKAEILENMKRKGTAAPNLTESDIDLDLNYPSDIESRYAKNENPLGQLFKQSLASVWQNRVLSHFQFAERFYINTTYREEFHEITWRRLEQHLLEFVFLK